MLLVARVVRGVPAQWTRRHSFPAASSTCNVIMRNRGVLTTACLAASLSLAAAQETAPREPRYLSFTARDRNKIYLRDLKLPEVSLFLDGQPAKVSYLG